MAVPGDARPDAEAERCKIMSDDRNEPSVAEPSEAELGDAAITLPEDAVVIVPTRGMVMFPGMVVPVAVGRAQSIQAAQEAIRTERPLGLLLQRDAADEDPKPDGLHSVGTMCAILRYLTAPDGSHHVICQGQQRFRVVEFLNDLPFLAARIEAIEEPEANSREIDALALQLRQRGVEALQLLPQPPQELIQALQGVSGASATADLVAGLLDISPEEKQEILGIFDVQQRLQKVLELVIYRIDVLRLSQQIDQQTKQTLDGRQREFLLREQLNTIRRELGEMDDPKDAEIAELRETVTRAGMPEDVETQANKELRRLERMPEAAAEYGMIRTYLDWLIDLPWQVEDRSAIDISAARAILDADHYGLEKIKRRILEFLAVRKLRPEGKSPILCFVGPPGVGKTSLGQSIARAMGREFTRISLGGVHDEAEIRGHRRTYVGSMPGTVIQAIRKAGTRNGVMMLDEMDKVGAGGFHGDPASALLEVLDPEQNATFRDNYLGVPFDLSQVMFIATANVLDAIPGPLRDRMEIIALPGYTEEEKLQIARRYLVARQLDANGLTDRQCTITDDALRRIIREYTREAGCRNLEREIGSVLRRVAVRVAEGEIESAEIGSDDIPEILGARRFENEAAMRTTVPGVATGLAWTPVGGDILFVEASRIPGSGRLILTGQLGDVMRESAQAALTLVKAGAERIGVDPAVFQNSDLHIHVPAGAIPKDGPSAGVAIHTALTSLLLGRTVRSDTAMTGEISLRGLVLPVGGIKEKAVAAVGAGIRRLVMPARNRKDFEDIPEDARKLAEFHWVETVDEVARLTLADSIGAPQTVRGDTDAPVAARAHP